MSSTGRGMIVPPQPHELVGRIHHHDDKAGVRVLRGRFESACRNRAIARHYMPGRVRRRNRLPLLQTVEHRCSDIADDNANKFIGD